MSLNGAFQIGRSGLTAAQLGITVTGNNVANAATPGYSRQNILLGATADMRLGNTFIGRGVDMLGIRRNVDDALQQRVWSSISGEGAANTSLSLLSTVETTLGGLNDTNLSTQLEGFFSKWTTLADYPNVAGNRSLVVQSGRQLASYMKDMRTNLVNQRTQLDQNLGSTISRANDLLDQLATLNTQITTMEGSSGNASGLRDQRDVVISEIAQYLDITPINQPNGGVDLLVGSTPIVLAGSNRGMEFRVRTVNGQVEVAAVTKDNKEILPITSGKIGAMLQQRGQLVEDAITRLDEIAAHIAFEVNRIHSVGSGSKPMTGVLGTLAFGSTDFGLSFNDPANATISGLPAGVRPTSGSFQVTVKNASTGSSQTVTVTIDLDGINAALAPGYANDTSLSSLATTLNGVANLSASISPDGKLKIDAANGYQVSFSDDTSGVLAVLGVNTFFKGTNAMDLSVRDELINDSNLVNAAWVTKGEPSDNGAALAIAQLRSKAVSGIGGVTFFERWDQAVQSVAVRTNAAATEANATMLVRQNLDAQKSTLSGVSLDEEAVSLMSYQRQYQASARFISVIDEITQTLLGMAQ